MNTEAMANAAKAITQHVADMAQMEVEKNVYQYWLPDALNVVSVSMSGGGNPDDFAAGCTANSLRIAVPVEARFAKPEYAHRFIVQQLSGLPKSTLESVTRLHLTATPQVAIEFVQLAGQGPEAPISICYRVSLALEAILDLS